MKQLLFLLLLVSACSARAQFAPQAGISGSTAIAATSHFFTGWATHCTVTRGLQQTGNPAGGFAAAGDSSLATGPADNTIVSLGDSGVALLTFASPITDGTGADFAVFENGFANPNNPEEAFLELAFVEVSSDGVHFTRFPATANTQDTVQIAAAGTYMNARLLNNLAGKYIGGYGTPFDLQELAGTPGLDINHITQVRLVDVIGSVGAHASVDKNGHKINDPYPTPFPTGGFDLDAVGVLHSSATGIANIPSSLKILAYPNPLNDVLHLETDPGIQGNVTITLTDISGRKCAALITMLHNVTLAMTSIAPGFYYLTVQDENGQKWVEKIVRR